MLAVPLQIRLHRAQDIPGRVGPALDLQGVGPIGQDPIRVAMLQAVSGPAEPLPRLRGGLPPRIGEILGARLYLIYRESLVRPIKKRRLHENAYKGFL